MFQGDTFSALGKVFGVGGVGLGALWIVMRSRFWEKKNGTQMQVEMPPAWELKARRMHEEYNEDLMKDMRNLMETRLAQVVSDAIKDALEPLPKEMGEALRRVLREKGL